MSRTPPVTCPFTLTVEPLARFLNCELDDPVYDGLELQWFDDPQHCTGMLAFLSRRADRRVDFYADPALTLDRSRFAIGAGIGSWNTTTFDAAHLALADDGVDAEVRFHDREGRLIEARFHDREGRLIEARFHDRHDPHDRHDRHDPHGRPHRRGALLAPVGSGIDEPLSLLLVHLHGFDLLRRGRTSTAEVRIDGRSASFGTLPGRALHRRELVKYAGPVDVITLNEARDGALPTPAPGSVRRVDGGIASVVAGQGPSRVRLEFRPAFPDVAALRDGETADGRWRIYPEKLPPLTGGTWRAARSDDVVTLELDVTERWRPGRLPALMELVTRVVPVFRRWPTTYRWRATVTLGEAPTMVSRWERTGERDDSYSKATGTPHAEG